MGPLEIACRHSCRRGNCGAEAGQFCNWSKCFPFADLRPQFHAERIEDAAAMTRGSGGVTPADFDQAVERSGLV